MTHQPTKLRSGGGGPVTMSPSSNGLSCRVAVLQQLSSVVIERFFSAYKGMTSTHQCAEDEETSLLRAQARYNKGKLA